MLNQQSSAEVGVIARAVRLSYGSLSLNQLGMSEISSSIKVAAKPLKTTKTSELPTNTSAHTTTNVAELRGHVRIDLLNHDAFSLCLVGDEVLKLKKAPVTNPIIHHFASSDFSDSFEVFQNDFVPVKIGNNAFAHVMIDPSHEQLLTPTDFSQKSLGAFCAFGLEFSSQIPELSFNHFYFTRGVEPAVRSDGKVVYSEVDTKNLLRSVVPCFDLFRKTESKKATTFSIELEQTLTHTPSIEVRLEVEGYLEWQLDSSLETSQEQFVAFELGASWKVVSDTSPPDFRLGLGFLNNSTGLLDTITGELGRQFLTQASINERMQFNVVLDSFSPRNINADLKASLIRLSDFEKVGIKRNLDFCTHDASHNTNLNLQVFKPYECPMDTIVKKQEVTGGNSSPQQDCSVSLPHAL